MILTHQPILRSHLTFKINNEHFKAIVDNKDVDVNGIGSS